MARKRFSFKSTGKLVTAREQIDPVVIKRPIGIKTPLEFSAGRNDEDFYKMHYDVHSQIKDNFRNLLLTNFGERLGRAELGANLMSLLYDMTDAESIEAETSQKIIDTAQRYLPMIHIKDINIGFLGLDTKSNDLRAASGMAKPTSLGLAGMVVRITYDIPNIAATNQVIEVIMKIAG